MTRFAWTLLGLLVVTSLPAVPPPPVIDESPMPARPVSAPFDPPAVAAPTPPTDPIPTPSRPSGNGTSATRSNEERLKQASDLFQQARTEPSRYAECSRQFAELHASRVAMTTDHLAAWAYCRIRLAADRWNASKGDRALIEEITAEIDDALRLAPGHAELQKVGNNVLATISGKSASPANPFVSSTPTKSPASSTPAAAPVSQKEWLVIENENFRVRYPAEAKDFAGPLLARAEELRGAIFRRWSGPPGSAWQPKCEINLHEHATAFQSATTLAAEWTGHALTRFEAGQVSERRIDLRADDATMLEDALPRELTYIVLSDLFRTKEPPRWAALGMAVLAASPSEVDRHIKSLPRIHRSGELLTIPTLLASTAPTRDNVTAYTVESVSLVDYLIRRKGEKSFTLFLRDADRYGIEQALERQYHIAGSRQLDDEWRRAVLRVTRGQQPGS